MNLPHLSSLPSWKGVRRVCIDTETHDEQLTDLGPGWRRGAEIVGISFAFDDGTTNAPAYYLPVGHAGGGNYHDPTRVWDYLRDQAKYFDGEIAGANLSYDLDGLANYRVMFEPKRFRDIMISGPLLDTPNLNMVPNLMSLEIQARRLGMAGKDESMIKAYADERGWHPKADLWRMPASIVADYAIEDVRLPLQVLKKHEQELFDQNLWSVYDMECELLPTLVKMRRRGVAVDLDGLDEIRHWCHAKEAELLHEVRRRTGVPIEVGDTKKTELIVKALCKADGFTETEGLPNSIPRTERNISDKTGLPTGGNLSVTAGWLESVNTPTSRQLLRARQVGTIRTNYCQSLFDHEIKGRIHCTINQLKGETESGDTKGTGGGRCSASDPNLQQQPVRDEEIGPRWRGLFKPDEGAEWGCLDFSSQEPRWITHFAEAVANMEECPWDESVRDAARKAAHLCRTDPNWDNHSMMAGMLYTDDFKVAMLALVDCDGNPTKIAKKAKALRGNAKTIFLGLAYGMGGGKLCVELELPTVKVVRNPDVRGWSVHPADSDIGQQLIRKGNKAFTMAGDEGKALLELFNQRVPFVKALAGTVANTAKAVDRGYITTGFGRRCRFPREGRGIGHTHKALNKLIQGTAADQMKLAMVAMEKAGVKLQLQVHDEVDFSVYDRNQAFMAAEIMTNIIPANVPFPVDVEVGPSWGDLKVITP